MYGTRDISAALNGDEIADTAILARHRLRQSSCSHNTSQRGFGAIKEN